jgi:uncharacterized membrane protein YgcG
MPTPIRRAASRLRPALWTATLAALLLAPTTLSSQARRLTLEAFTATIEVEPSGWLDVREELSFRFDGSWNGVFRTIPVEYDTGGSTRRLLLEVVDVRDPAGRSLEHETSREGAYRKVKIWVPDAEDATRTVIIHYRARDAVRFFESHDELYWNVTGNEWDMAIDRAVARVILPGGATGRRAAAYTGAYGERGGQAVVEEVEEGFFFRTSAPLAFREGLTVVVGWDPGVVHRPGPVERAIRRGAFLFLLPLVSLAGMWRLWAARGRDPRRRAVNPRYEPPEGMRPAEAGTLVDNSPDLRDMTAGIVDLAVRGYLVIEEQERSGLGKIFGKDEFTFRQRRLPDDTLRAHERSLLDALFRGSNETTTKELEHKFYKHIPDLKRALFAQLLTQGYYHHRPDKVLQAYVGIGVAMTAIAIAGLAVLSRFAGYDPLFGVLAGAGTGLPVILFGLFMPARTIAGARRLEEVLGFEEFMDRVESDRFRRMIKSPEQFEAYLPFAMALGVEKRWARAFEGIFTEAPSWYVGHHPGGFRPTLFVASLDSMASRASSAMTSAPRSSGSSGFSSGGGFSGGGSGGGGGGGF